MLNHLRNTVKHTAIYSLGNLSTKIIGLILLPLYTSYLTTAEYGIFSILEVTSQFFTAVVSLGLTAGMMRWYAVEDDEQKRKIIVFTTWVTTFILALFVNVAFYPANKWFSSIFFSHDNYADYFLILWLWVGLEVVNRIPFELLRLKEKSLLFVTLVIIKFVLILVLNIYFIVYMKMGVKGIILSQVIGINGIRVKKTMITGKSARKKSKEIDDALKVSLPSVKPFRKKITTSYSGILLVPGIVIFRKILIINASELRRNLTTLGFNLDSSLFLWSNNFLSFN
jgi:O-antigen/teichoic acid export membrane protein